jgi:peptide/nickel transport system substrate-binding protein
MWETTLMKRRWASGVRLVAAAAAVGLLAASCATDDPDTGSAQGEGTESAATAAGEPSGEPQHGGSIAVGLEAETVGWAPWQDNWANAGNLVSTTFYDRLAGRDEEGQVRPALAESITPNDDFTEYTVVLREGIEFHDGEPLNAEAVAANLAKHREPGSATSSDVAPVADVVVEDDLTVRVELDQPHVAFADRFVGQAGVMVSPASIEAETTSREPVGTGPFVFESWQRDQELVVSRNENYWRDDLPYLDEITFRPIPDEETRLQSLFSDDVQVMQSLRQSIVAQAREREDEFNLYEHLGNNAGGAIYNLARPPLDDVRVRKAIAHSLNQDEIISVLGGTGITPPAKGLFTAESPWYVDDIEDAWPEEDLDTAQELYDDYVDDPDRSDGKNAGDPVEFTVDTPPDPSLLETAAVYQAQLGRVGFEVDIRTVEQAVHIQQAVGDAPDFIGDFDAKFWRLGQEADPDWLVGWFSPGSPTNFTNIESEELVDLMLEARRTPDFEQRRELYNQVMLLFADQMPFTLTGYTATVLATHPGIFGFDDWEFPDGTTGNGASEAVAPWHSVWLDE